MSIGIMPWFFFNCKIMLTFTSVKATAVLKGSRCYKTENPSGREGLSVLN